MTLAKNYTYACGTISSNSTYQGQPTDSDVALASICDKDKSCAGFTIYFVGIPFNADETTPTPDSFCFKSINDPKQLYSAAVSTMMNECYGFFSKQNFNASATSQVSKIQSGPNVKAKISDADNAKVANAASATPPIVALTVPPSVSVPTTRHTLPANYVFGSDDGLANDDMRRTLKQSIYGDNPLSDFGGPVILKTLFCYTIWLGFTENDPHVAWAHYFLANLDQSTSYRVIPQFTSSKDGGANLAGTVKLSGSTFLNPRGTASLNGFKSTVAVIGAVVKYALRNKLVDPSSPNHLYFVFAKTDNPALIMPPADGLAGWHTAEEASSCFLDPNGKNACGGGPCTCKFDLAHTFAYVPTSTNPSTFAYFNNHDPATSPSGDPRIDYFIDTVNHEVMETQTDPSGGSKAWMSGELNGAQGKGKPGKVSGENGDLCNDVYLPAVQITNDGTSSASDVSVSIPSNVLLPTTTAPAIAGGTRTACYNVLVGGYPYLLQAQYLPTINPANGRQWGCVVGIDANGKPITDPR